MSWQLRLLLGAESAPSAASIPPPSPAPSRAVELHENERIARLPRWVHDDSDCTDLHRVAGGTMRLFQLQNRALNAARAAGGGVFLLGCGVGKTLLSFLLGPHLGAERVLLLVPAALREKTKAEAQLYKKHFKFDLPKILSYEMLSRASGLEELRGYAPDLIVCDEAHALKDLSSARTGRVGIYLSENPECRLVVMSGTLFNKTIGDFAHLSDWALEENSPVPRNMRDVQEWDVLLSGEGDDYQKARFRPMYRAFGNGARSAVFARLSAAKGVVLTTEDTVPCSLQLSTRSLNIPPDLRVAINSALSCESPMADVLDQFGLELDLDSVRASQHLWDNPDSVALHTLGQLISGMLYFWKWDNNVADDDWLEARRDWRKAVRQILELGLENFDSPGLIYDFFEELPPNVQRAYGAARAGWEVERVKKEPPREVIWVSDYLIDDIASWFAQQRLPVLIWVDSIALGERISTRLGIPYYGGGVEFDTKNAHSCVLSIASHGTGKNLQSWSINLVVSPIASPQIWEQLLARTHRTGQLADTVQVFTYSHSVFGGAFRNALRQAQVVGDTCGQRQRICYADRVKGAY